MTASQPIPTPEEVWRDYDEAERRLTAPLSDRMIALAGLRPGMRVLDVATGRGEPAIRAARAVAPSGGVVGIDIAASMLDMARDRANREGITNLDLRVADAETLEGVPDAAFDVSLARWGLMYFASPVRALAAIRRKLTAQGVLVMAVWAEPECVDYFTLPRRILARHAPVPVIDFSVPGTFHYANEGRLRRDLEIAGFRCDSVEERYTEVMETRTGAGLVAWTRAFGLTKLLNALATDVQAAWEQDLIAEGERRRRDGFIRLGGVSRIAVARPAP